LPPPCNNVFANLDAPFPPCRFPPRNFFPLLTPIAFPDPLYFFFCFSLWIPRSFLDSPPWKSQSKSFPFPFFVSLFCRLYALHSPLFAMLECFIDLSNHTLIPRSLVFLARLPGLIPLLPAFCLNYEPSTSFSRLKGGSRFFSFY